MNLAGQPALRASQQSLFQAELAPSPHPPPLVQVGALCALLRVMSGFLPGPTPGTGGTRRLITASHTPWSDGPEPGTPVIKTPNADPRVGS
ncbi:hypothetical protein GCM10010439_71360 [Actinocorallia aurantiaca]|uniref:Uncharacterized protein n=1 Tax=Actinocorallia aurantiaca TaxID=46204 RepID=A0ABN3UTL1_9ACTN